MLLSWKHALLFTLLFLCYACVAQQYPTYRLSTKDGLSHPNVFRILQDSHGYLWLSTEFGLCRYDGVSIKCFGRQDGLLSNVVMHTSQDSSGCIWAYTYFGGMQYYKQGRFYKPDTSYGDHPRYVIKSLHTDHRDWYLSTHYLHWQRNDTIHTMDAPVPGARVLDMEKWGPDTLVVRTDSGVFLLDERMQWQVFPFVSKHKAITAIRTGAAGEFWLAHEHGIYHVAHSGIIDSWACDFAKPPDQMVAGADGMVWVSDFQSLYKVSNGQVENVTQKVGATNLKINHMLIDNQQHLWIATYGFGVICVLSEKVLHFPIDGQALNNPVNNIFCKDGRIYAASMGALSVYDGQRFALVPSSFHTAKDFPYSLDTLGERMMLGNQRNVFVFDPNHPAQQEMLYEQSATALLRTSSGHTWVGSFLGLRRSSAEGLEQVGNKVRNRRITSLCEWDEGVVVGTDSGLYYIGTNGEECLYSHRDVGSNYITALMVASNGTLWVAHGKGLMTMERTPGGEMVLKHEESIAGIQQMFEVQDHSVWIATLYGLLRLKGTEVQRFSRAHGIMSDRVHGMTWDTTGTLWLATMEGISCFQPDLLTLAQPPIQISIASVIADSSMFEFPDHVQLSTTHKNIRVSFIYPQFPYVPHRAYQYQLAGLDNEWYNLNEQTLQITSLPAGSYLLRMRHSDWPETSHTALPLTVTAPFYQRPWFYWSMAGCGGLIIALVSLFILQQRERQVRQKLRERLRVTLLRTQALQAMVNPHFIFNSLNAVLALVQADRKQDVKTYVGDFSNLLRTVLERSGNAVISIADELTTLRLYLQLQQMRYGDRLAFEIHCDPSVDLNLKIPNMLLQPFVENAVQHGIAPQEEGGTINVLIRQKARQLEIYIEDDGIGLSNGQILPKKERSLGIHLIRQRLNLMEKISGKPQTLRISDHPSGVGTQVCIVLWI